MKTNTMLRSALSASLAAALLAATAACGSAEALPDFFPYQCDGHSTAVGHCT